MDFKNVVISGNIGSGTSTLAKSLSEKLGWKHYSTGDFFREYHLENNIPLWNTSAIPPELDRQIDTYIFEQLSSKKHFVIDSHYAGWFTRGVKTVFRILLNCDQKESIRRVINRHHTHKESREGVIERIKQLDQKFRSLYADDNYIEPKYFNLVIDTTKSTPEETLTHALKAIEKRLPR